MENNFILLITALLTAGSIGFINCFILEKLEILNFRKSNEQDRKHFLLLFSLFNYVMYLLLYICIKNRFSISEELILISISVILTIILTTILSIFIFPFMAIKFNNMLNFLRKYKKLSEVDHRSTRDIVLNNEKKQSVFIFDFNKVLISSGYLQYYNSESDYYEIVLVPFDEKPYLDNYDKVKDYSESENGQEKNIKILLDFEKNLQYFIIN